LGEAAVVGSQADLRGANLNGAKLNDTDLGGTDLSGTAVSQRELDQACGINDEFAEASVCSSVSSRFIDDARYPLSPRITVLREILAKLRPEPARPAASPEPRVYAPPSRWRYGRRH
jgi:hypothetical protein